MDKNTRWNQIKSEEAKQKEREIIYLATFLLGIFFLPSANVFYALFYFTAMIMGFVFLHNKSVRNKKNRHKFREALWEGQEQTVPIQQYKLIKRGSPLSLVEVQMISGETSRMSIQIEEGVEDGITLEKMDTQGTELTEKEKVQFLMHNILWVPKKREN